MNVIGRTLLGVAGGAAAVVLIGSPALADECINASKKNAGAGAQIVIGEGDEVVFATKGVENRIEHGLIDPENEGEGYHGLLGIDFDGDEQADLSTWIGVGPDGHALPSQAQFNGPPCKGITNIGVYFTECLPS